jgi:hypothetical protein
MLACCRAVTALSAVKNATKALRLSVYRALHHLQLELRIRSSPGYNFWHTNYYPAPNLFLLIIFYGNDLKGRNKIEIYVNQDARQGLTMAGKRKGWGGLG